MLHFAQKYGFNQGNISRIENGLMRAPQDPDRVDAYARALGLKKGTAEWVRFHDLAKASNRTFEIFNITNDSVLEAFPILMRELDKDTVTKDHLEKLIDLVKKVVSPQTDFILDQQTTS